MLSETRQKKHGTLMKKADHATILELEAQYCSYGDTVHYVDPAKKFAACSGGFLYDDEDRPYFDLQMQYSAANLGYGDVRLTKVLNDQIQVLSQLDSQHLHEQRTLLAEKLAALTEQRFGVKGRVHFSVGGAGAIEDSLCFVRKATGKNFHFAFMGGYHGRTQGASAITAATATLGIELSSFRIPTASAVSTISSRTPAVFIVSLNSKNSSIPTATRYGTLRSIRVSTELFTLNRSRALGDTWFRQGVISAGWGKYCLIEGSSLWMMRFRWVSSERGNCGP